MRRCLVVLALLPLAGCGGSGRAANTPRVVSVGRPTTPERVPIQQGGTIELRAPGAGRSPAFRLAVLHAPGGDPRDLCVATFPIGAPYVDYATQDCDVPVPGEAAVFAGTPGVDARLGPAPTVVSGIAPHGVARVEVDGPGGRRVLPLSRHRAFLALYAPGTHGEVRIHAGRVVRRLSLPLGRHERPFPRHRRRGAVYSDEVGEPILERSYAQILRGFGPPAARGRHRGHRCLRYEAVGEGSGGWWFCFREDGRMVSAAHSS